MDATTILILFVFQFISAVYGVVVGSGELLIVPVLVNLGLPSHIAIGTARAGHITAPVVSLFEFKRKKLVNFKIAVRLAIVGILGFALGLLLYFNINELMLKYVIAGISLVMLGVIIFKKKAGIKKIKVLQRSRIFGWMLVFVIAIYAGFYGIGFPTLLAYVLIFLFGLTFLQAAGTRKIFCILQILVTVPVFLIANKVFLVYVPILLIASAIGAYVGAHYSDKIGNVWVKRAFIVITLIVLIKMFL